MKETVDELLKKTSIKPQSDYMEDIVAYRNSIMIEMERQSALEFAKEEGKEEGREEGIEVGKMEVAREMKKKGMLLGDIMLFTGLSEQQIEKL